MAGGSNPAYTQTVQAPLNVPTGAATSAPAPSVYDQSAQAYNQALAATTGAMAGPNTRQFMNPYTQQVTGQTLADLERQRQMAVNQTAADATAAGAFGGSRHGVSEALTNEAYALQSAETLANLNQQGYNTALSAAQNQQNIQLAGANQLGGLSNLGFGYGQQINADLTEQGNLQQALNQALIDAGRNQFGGFANAPVNSLAPVNSTLQAANMGQGSQTTSSSPGLFDYLALGVSLF